MRIYQQGIEIAISGKRHTIPFATVSEVTTKITHVYMRNGNYLGSQIDLQLKVDEKYRVIQWSLEYRKGGRQERLLNAVLSNLASSVGERLKSELLEKGRLDWTANAHLTSDGLMIEDPFTHRFIHYEDIEECRLEESTLRIFRTSDVLPVFECRYDCPNASAYLYLLQLLSRSARKISTEMQMV